MTTGSLGRQSDSRQPSGRVLLAERFPLLTRVGLAAAWAVGALAAFQGVRLGIADGNLGSDSHAYWLTRDRLPYDLPPGTPDAFLYSPAFAQAIHPLTLLPWPLFLAAWIALEVAALAWLLWPLTWRWAVPLALLCVPELVNGNVYILLAAATVLAVARPWMWAFPALTKALPAAGGLWHVFRGEWSAVWRAATVGVFVVATSYALAPDDWARWVEFLLHNGDGAREGPALLVVRVLLALWLLWWGARRGHAWVLAPFMVLMSPALAPTTATLLIALPRLMDKPESAVR